MSILKFLFGVNKLDNKRSGNKNMLDEKIIGEDEYKGFIISAIEMKSGSEYQICGKIEKELEGELKIKKFIRADRLATREEACKFTHKKGRQIIDEQGDNLFSNDW